MQRKKENSEKETKDLSDEEVPPMNLNPKRENKFNWNSSSDEVSPKQLKDPSDEDSYASEETPNGLIKNQHDSSEDDRAHSVSSTDS